MVHFNRSPLGPVCVSVTMAVARPPKPTYNLSILGVDQSEITVAQFDFRYFALDGYRNRWITSPIASTGVRVFRASLAARVQAIALFSIFPELRYFFFFFAPTAAFDLHADAALSR
jgi:hypothetical protein